MRECPDCGVDVEPDDTHCYNCGRSLDGPSETDRRPPQHGPDESSPQERPRGRRYDQNQGQYQQDQGQGQYQQNQGQGQYGGQGQYQQNQGQYGGQGQRQQGQYGGQGQPQQGQYQQGPPRDPGPRVEDGKISYALKLPYAGGWKELLLGSVCGLFAWLLIPAVFLSSYLYQLTGAATRGSQFKPDFGDSTDTLVPGLVFFLVFVGIVILNNVIQIALGAGPTTTGATGTPGTTTTDLNLGAQLLSFGVTQAIFYFVPAFYTGYAATGSFSGGISAIPNFSLTKKYFVSYLVYLVISIAIGVAVGIAVFVLFITIIGWILLPFVIPAAIVYAYYFMASYWGAVYYEAAQEGIVPPATGRTQQEPAPRGQPQQQRY